MERAYLNATEEPSEANLVKLLDLWSAGWKHRGRTRAVGPGAYERYATLGLFGHGGVVGVSNATSLREHRRAGVDRRRRSPRLGWKTRRAAGSCEGGGWTCTTSPSASMLAATTRSNPTRAACGLLLPMSHKPMLRRRSSTGRR